MRTLTDQEKRTVRIGALIIAIVLVGSGLLQGGRFFERQRTQYAQLRGEADSLKREIRLYTDRAASAQKLMDAFKLDPVKLTNTTVVAEASAAIQKAAASSGIGVGAVRESPARAANKELATVQLEGTGPVPSVTAFLSRLESVGFPLIIESVQLTPVQNPPGQMKMSLTIVILDFDQWKKEGAPNA
ncbi:MAG: hypothetical protein C5B50_27455 [Verrucomicrobia bacterium]|nr:MAG: hypothetical protein C5B50_27455 [Verrucomicrobiota bacterium]